MLHLDHMSKIPFYMQIYKQLREDILSGALPAGTRLISTRELAKELQAGRNTIENAYAQLAVEGYVTPVRGGGHIVNEVHHDINPDMKLTKAPEPISASTSPGSQSLLLYDLDYAKVDGTLFPYRIWRRTNAAIFDEAAKNRPGCETMHSHSGPKGILSFREEIAGYLYRSRGVNCTAGQVIICSGIQPALETIIQLLPFERKMVAMEEPGYNGARITFQNNGVEVFPVSVFADGIDLHVLATSSAKVVHIAPSHQFPMGAVMPIQKRFEILKWANENGNFIIEDDFDSEFRYNTKPIPSLQSIDREGRVIYMGTFSKALSAGLRVGYLVLPSSLLPAFEKAYRGVQCTVPTLIQQILSRFIAEGHWERHIRKLCQIYKKRHDALVNGLNAAFEERIRIQGQNAGLHILVEVAGIHDEQELIRRAASVGIQVYPVSPCWLQQKQYLQGAVLLGFATVSEAEIPLVVSLLSEAWST